MCCPWSRIRGCLKGLTCDYHGAIVDLNSVIEHRHDSRAIPAYVERGVFKFLQGDCEGAVLDFDTAIHYGPEQPLEVIRLRSLVRKVSVLMGATMLNDPLCSEESQ
jgi:hypothetical protein